MQPVRDKTREDCNCNSNYGTGKFLNLKVLDAVLLSIRVYQILTIYLYLSALILVVRLLSAVPA